mgnify:CR=1 FL=1
MVSILILMDYHFLLKTEKDVDILKYTTETRLYIKNNKVYFLLSILDLPIILVPRSISLQYSIFSE